MNRKTLYLNILAAALLSVAGTVQAKAMPLADAVHLQMRAASAGIQADMRANVMNQPRTLDVHGVEVGPIELVEDEPAPSERGQASRSDASLDLAELIRQELALKALATPGMFGVYRYMTQSALGVATIVAE